MISSYPKIWNHYQPGILDLCKDVQFFVQEKIDGSQFSFRKETDESVSFRSKGVEVRRDDAGMFSKAVASVEAVADRLLPGWTYRAEYVSKPKHNTIKYDRAPAGFLVIFDIFKPDGLRVPPEVAKIIALDLCMEYVYPEEGLFFGHEVEKIKNFLNLPSMLGGDREGVVMKPLDPLVIHPMTFEPVLIKIVREDFKEKHKSEWKVANNLDVQEKLIAELAHPRRWEKTVEKLRDAGRLQNAPQDIGMLLKAVRDDICEEEAQYIKDRLFEAYSEKILRGACKGVVNWYKERLGALCFDESSTS